MVWCLTYLIGKIHLPPNKILWMDLMCKFDGHMLYCNLEFWLNCLGSSLSLLEFHEDSKLKEYSHVKKLDKNCHCIANWCNYYEIVYCEWLAMKPGFLTGSFPEEPWTRLHIKRDGKRDYEVGLQCLWDFKI